MTFSLETGHHFSLPFYPCCSRQSNMGSAVLNLWKTRILHRNPIDLVFRWALLSWEQFMRAVCQLVRCDPPLADQMQVRGFRNQTSVIGSHSHTLPSNDP